MPTPAQPRDSDPPEDSGIDWQGLLAADAEAAAISIPDASAQLEKEDFDEKGVKRVFHLCLRWILIGAAVLFGVLLLARTASLVLPHQVVDKWLSNEQIQVMDKVILSIGSGLVGSSL